MVESSVEKMQENQVGVIMDKSILATLGDMWTSAKNYRNNFAPAWEEIENQINLNPPEDWAEKEDWQTQIMTPEQFKIAETATANMMAMLFGTDKFFGVTGVDSQDKEKVSYMTQFMLLLLREGGFYDQNSYTIHESIELGTSFMKKLINKKTQGFDFSFRTVKDIVFDPESFTTFKNCKYVIEEYDMDIFDILKESRFTQDGKDALLKALNGKSDKRQKDLISISNTGGVSYDNIESKYQRVTIREFWGYLPVTKEKDVDGEKVEFTDNEWRTVSYVDGVSVVLADEESGYDYVPYLKALCRRRRDHTYGYGYCFHIRGLQNYINSLLNLGFDAAKIASMPIMKIDEANVPDPSSIEVKPLAKWNMQENQMDAVEIVTYNVNTMPDVLVSMQQADGLIQEASGINKYAQGNDTLFGKGEETLGQSQMKLQSVQRRSLKVAKEMAEDYVIPLVESIFSDIVNPKFIKMFQKKADRTIGVRTIPNPQFQQLVQQGANPQELVQAGIQPQIQESKLNLKELGEMHLDFMPLSLVNYVQKTEQLERIERLLRMAAENPNIAPFINMDATMNRWASMQELDDYKELFTTVEQRQQALNMIKQQQAQKDAMDKKHEIMRDREKANGKINLQEAKVKGLMDSREHEMQLETMKEEMLGGGEDEAKAKNK